MRNLPDDEPPAELSVVDRTSAAPTPRTLIDVLRATAAQHAESGAIEDANGTLTYAELLDAVAGSAADLRRAGVRRGDRVGVRMPSGSRGLYVGILSILGAGAAYVPVDADDPPERAALVFGEADVAGVLTVNGYEPAASPPPEAPPDTGSDPQPENDAWVIFTSGSTGVPKAVAVTHRSAAAFVDAEAQLFSDAALGPGDRVLAGLSVAFDASCEEMWLAWRYGACLVPAPRSIVRSGADLGGWLVRHRITVVSTVPTLAALWPTEALEQVRLLIFGGEACPPELAARLVADGRAVWNTYGPTEATVVATAARLDGVSPVLIGAPLPGWAIAVVDSDGRPVPPGTTGELVIGGVGLARYLDPAKDADKYAPLPWLGWHRAYRSGDLVALEPGGLAFHGRADDQVKVGGRRIELGEVEAALAALPGVEAAAVAVRTTEAGVAVLVGYLVAGKGFDRQQARAELAERLPAPMIPLLARLDDLPTRTSGKVDRDALPWPLPEVTQALTLFSGDEAWLARQWLAVLGTPVLDRRADFFELGGGSLAAAQLVSRIRTRAPEFSVADVYDHPRLAAMATAITETEVDTPWRESFSKARATPLATRWAQTLASVPLFAFSGARWLVYLLSASWVLRTSTGSDAGGFSFLPAVNGWLLLLGLLLFAVPFGRMAIAAGSARLLLAGLRPGDYHRGGRTHLRLWLAEQISQQVDPVGLAGAPWVTFYARALGARIGRDVDLHTLPPVTGMLRVGDGASIEPEVDLSGYWIDGETVRIGAVRIGAGASVGTRSTLAPGTRIDPGAEVAPGSAVFGRVRSGQLWAGSPAARAGEPSLDWPAERPPRGSAWLAAYGASSMVLGLLPIAAFSVGGLVVAHGIRGSADVAGAVVASLPWLLPGVAAAGITFSVAIIVGVRLLAIGMTPGTYPVRSRVGWQVWTTERLLDYRPHAAVPAVRQPRDPALAPAAGREGGQERRGVDRGAVAVADHDRRRRLPGRRHHGGLLRPAQRLAADRAGDDRQACVPGQLRHRRRRPHRAPRRPRRGAVGGPGQGEAGLVLAGFARGAAAPGRGRRRPGPHLPPDSSPGLGTGGLGGRTPDRGGHHQRRRPRRAADHGLAGRGSRHRLDARAVGPGDDGGRDRGRSFDDSGEMAGGGPDPARRAAPVVELRLAYRGGRHLHRDGRRALVRQRQHRHAGPGVVAAQPGRDDRTRGVVRDLLAARTRPGHAR